MVDAAETRADVRRFGALRTRPTVLLAYPPERRERLFPEPALTALERIADVRLLRNDARTAPLGWIDEAKHISARAVIADRIIDAPSSAFARLPELDVFVRGAMDVRTVDLTAAAHHGVRVIHGSAHWVDAVCELILGLMVSSWRSIPDAVAAYRAGRVPEQREGRQLAGSDLGVIGVGHLGRRMIDLGRSLRMRVRVSDPFVNTVPSDVPNLPLPQLLAASDVVVLVAAHTPATENLIDADALSRMRDGALLVNVGRGGLVDERALADALRSNKIGGAAMDVGRGPDDVPSVELANLPNVIATPHVGGAVSAAAEAHALETVRQLHDLMRGRRPAGTLIPTIDDDPLPMAKDEDPT